MAGRPPDPPEGVDPSEAYRDYIGAVSDPALIDQAMQGDKRWRDQSLRLGLEDIWGYVMGVSSDPHAGDMTGIDESIAMVEKQLAEYEKDPNTHPDLIARTKENLEARRAERQQLLESGERSGGIIELMEMAVPRIGEIFEDAATQQRMGDVEDVELLGKRATEAFRASDPEMQALLEQQKGLVDQAYDAIGAGPSEGELWERNKATNEELEISKKVVADPEKYGATPQQVKDAQARIDRLTFDRDSRALEATTGAEGRLRHMERDVLYQQKDIYDRMRTEDQLASDALERAAGIEDIGWEQISRAKEFDQGLSAQQERQAQQQAREAAGARGVASGNMAAASEILNREDFLRQNRAEARTMRAEGAGWFEDALIGRGESAGYRMASMGLRDEAARRRGEAQGLRAEQRGLRDEEALRMGQAGALGGQYFGMLGATSIDPFQAILGRPSGAGSAGMDMIGTGAGLANMFTGPQTFDMDTGINMELMNQSNLANYQSNIYGAQAGFWSGLLGGAGSIIGGGIGG